MTADEWERLDALAAAATPGPWWHAGGGLVLPPSQVGHVAFAGAHENPNARADAAYIAAASPDVVRRLIADLRSANERAEMFNRKRIEREELQAAEKARADAAEAEVARQGWAGALNERDGFRDTADRLRAQRDEARAALDRVLHLCDEIYADGTTMLVDIEDVRRALDGAQ